MVLKSKIDDILSLLGYGRWQVSIHLFTFWLHLYIPIHLVGSTLLSVPMSFRCFPSLSAPTEGASNVSSTTTTSQPLAATYDNVCEPTNQTMFPPSPSAHMTTLPSCSVLEYDPAKFSDTVITEFDLVCERSVLRPLFQMSVAIGVPFGALLGGVISDMYGRRTVIFTGSVCSAVGVVALFACPWYVGVLICRFLLGITVSLIVLPSYSLSQEVTPSHLRSQAGMLVGLGFSLGAALMAGIGYLVRPWRYLLLITSSPLLVIIPWACMTEESPRWLSQKGRQKEAADALERAAHRNRVSMTPELVTALENLRGEKMKEDAADDREDAEGVRVSLTGLCQCFGQCRNYFRYPGLRNILLASPAVWYLQSLMYGGIILNANNFTSNDPYLYVAVSGVIDGLAIILTTPLTMRVGRRLLTTILYSVSGGLLLLDTVIPAASEVTWLKWIFVMTAFLLSSAAYQIQFIYTPELYPTAMRSRGFGISSSVGSMGLVTAPFITDLLAQQARWSVNVVCAAAGLIASMLMQFLPETRNLPLPETLQDVEKRLRTNKDTGDSKVVDELNPLRSLGEPPPEGTDTET